MKRFFGILGIVGLLLGAFGVGAQNGCDLGLSDEDCELLEEAFAELADNGDLNFDFSLSVQLFYGANARRQLFLSGAGVLERDNNGAIESFEISAFVTARAYNNYDFLNREEIFTQHFFDFEENEFSFAEADSRGELIEFDVESLNLGTLFPFLTEHMAGNVSAETIELQREEYRHYLADLTMPIEGGLFAPFYRLIFGDEIADLSGEGFYDASVLINLDDGEIAGTSYSAYEFLDGEVFGLEQDLRRQTNWMLRILPENVSSFVNPRVGDEQEDEEGIYTEAAQYGPLGLMAAALVEPVSEIYPPMSANAELGGIPLDEVMGGESAADETATSSRTPSPSITVTPRPTTTAIPVTAMPTQEGFPCTAAIAGDEGSIQSVVHREPTEEAVVVVAARAGQEVRVTSYIDNAEGRWYHVEINRAVGYVHEDFIVLGDECGG